MPLTWAPDEDAAVESAYGMIRFGPLGFDFFARDLAEPLRALDRS